MFTVLSDVLSAKLALPAAKLACRLPSASTRVLIMAINNFFILVTPVVKYD